MDYLSFRAVSSGRSPNRAEPAAVSSGVMETNGDHATLVCDPDKLLNDYYDSTSGRISALGLLDAATRHIRRNSECICDTAGPQGRAFGHDSVCQQNPPLGFAVSVAVLGKMEVSDEQRRRYRSGAHLPAIFANELRNRLQRGQCADDVLIVLAINDSSTAQAQFFSRSDYTGGLLYMLDEYGRRLGAPPFRVEQIKEREAVGWWDTNFWPLFPEALRQSEIRWFWLLGYHLGQRTKENGKK
ncbi:hypothetical protein niasHS_015934 [Heterodera schachtii]|uniref:Uncharacterized protein n=1 Tax=Heterodera schachtii TaxID=97005 RepID=A0ABD2HXQ0_HETSC